jgi:hypothetical protein
MKFSLRGEEEKEKEIERQKKRPRIKDRYFEPGVEHTILGTELLRTYTAFYLRMYCFPWCTHRCLVGFDLVDVLDFISHPQGTNSKPSHTPMQSHHKHKRMRYQTIKRVANP